MQNNRRFRSKKLNFNYLNIILYDGIISSSSIYLNTFTTWVQNSFDYCPIKFSTRTLAIVRRVFLYKNIRV